MQFKLSLLLLVAAFSAVCHAQISHQPLTASPVHQLKAEHWIDAMNSAVKFLSVEPVPGNWGNLMNAPATTGSFGSNKVGADTYAEKMKTWPIPAEFLHDAQANVGLLVITASEGEYVSQTFVFSTAAGRGSLSSLVVVARRDTQAADPNNPVEVGYYIFNTQAGVKQQYTDVATRECHRCAKCAWLKKCCCSDRHSQVPRGATPAELRTIQLRMQHDQADFYNAHPPTSLGASADVMQVRPHGRHAHKAAHVPAVLKQNVLKGLFEILQKFVERWDVLYEVRSNYTDPIIAKLQNVTQEVRSSSSHSKLFGIKPSLFMMAMKSVTKAYNVYDTVSPFFEEDMVSSSFSHEIIRHIPGDPITQYVWILGTQHADTHLYDISLLTTKVQWDVTGGLGNDTQDITVLRNSEPADEGDFEEESFSILYTPWPVNTTEVAMDILRYMAAVTLLEKQKVHSAAPAPHHDCSLHLTPVKSPEDLSDTPAGGVDAVTGLTQAVQGIASAWQSIATAFKTTINQEVKQIIRLGFNKFHQKSTVAKAFSVPESKVEQFLELMVRSFKLPDDDRTKLVLFQMSFLPEASWDVDDFLYAIPGTGSDKALLIFKNGNSTSNLANFFVVDIEANFALAPDLMLVRTQRSFAGGIFSDDKTKIQEIPHVLSLNDAVQLQNFFKIVAMGKMAEVLGIPFTFPTIPPI